MVVNKRRVNCKKKYDNYEINTNEENQKSKKKCIIARK